MDLADLSPATLQSILQHALKLKQNRSNQPKGSPDANPAAPHSLALALFLQPSSRTRFSFQTAMKQIGGSCIVADGRELNIARGESLHDTALVASKYADILIVRTPNHQELVNAADHSSIPVVNAMTSRSHPCQALADVLTLQEHFPGPLAQRRVAWVGLPTNVGLSWLHAAHAFGFQLIFSCPGNLQPPQHDLMLAQSNNPNISLVSDPQVAVRNAECVVTDTWLSMGDAPNDAPSPQQLAPYQVNSQLMSLAQPNAVFLHCLPAYRGREVTADVLDGPSSLALNAAENRLHVQKSVLSWCLHAPPFS